MSDFELGSGELSREFVIMVALPSERLRPDSTRPKQHRYRALDAALAARLQTFRGDHDLTQAEVAAAVGAANKSVVAEWENATRVPSGMRRRRLIELLDGKDWYSLRATPVATEDMAPRWQQAIRWYRRASRALKNRRTVGEVILSTLEEVRRVSSIDELRQHYRERDSGWSANSATAMLAGATVRLAEDAAYGLRWIEIVTGTTIDPRRSLVDVVPIN